MKKKLYFVWLLTVIMISSGACGNNDHNSIRANMTTEDEGRVQGEIMSYSASFSVIKAYLATMPGTIDGLLSRGCLVIDNNGKTNGERNWVKFYEAIRKHEPAQLIIAQFTEDNEAILDFLSYDGKDVHHVSDCSRDRYSSEEDAYYEDRYLYCKLFEHEEKNGQKVRDIVLTNDDRMTYQKMRQLFMGDSDYGYNGDYPPDSVMYIAGICN